jgi:lysozyme family protein
LQRELHVADDGVWGPQTIRALQRKLNSDWRR